MIRARAAWSAAFVLAFSFPLTHAGGWNREAAFAFQTGQTAPAAGPAVAAKPEKISAGRITVAANVTLRALPSMTAAAVAQLPLGTELIDAGPADLDRTWLRVKIADGREGWLRGNLTKTIDPAWRWPAFDRLIAERLGRKGDGFAAQAELVAFIDRVAPEYTDPEGRARIDLARLRAIQAALGSMPFDAGRREPYAAWIAARKSDVTIGFVLVNEICGCVGSPGKSTRSCAPLVLNAATCSASDLPSRCDCRHASRFSANTRSISADMRNGDRSKLRARAKSSIAARSASAVG